MISIPWWSLLIFFAGGALSASLFWIYQAGKIIRRHKAITDMAERNWRAALDICAGCKVCVHRHVEQIRRGSASSGKPAPKSRAS